MLPIATKDNYQENNTIKELRVKKKVVFITMILLQAALNLPQII